MQGLITLIVLFCASMAAMAFGVLTAYGICRMAFHFLRIHARAVALGAQSKPQVARLT